MNSTSDEHFDAYLPDETSVWASQVNHNHVGYFIYILVIPIFCIFGIVTNSLNAIIFSRPKMVSSSYIYFTGIYTSYFYDSFNFFLNLFNCVSSPFMFGFTFLFSFVFVLLGQNQILDGNWMATIRFILLFADLRNYIYSGKFYHVSCSNR